MVGQVGAWHAATRGAVCLRTHSVPSHPGRRLLKTCWVAVVLTTVMDNSLRVERHPVGDGATRSRAATPGLARAHLLQAFHDNRLTPTQALRELIQTAQVAARQSGRPFNNVLELLPNADDETEGEASHTVAGRTAPA